MKKWMLVATVVLVPVSQAMALSLADSGPGTGTEQRLWQIVNTLYGTSYADNASLAGIQLNHDQIFELFGPNTIDASFRARFAGSAQQFGYYSPVDAEPGPGPVFSDLVPLITVSGLNGRVVTDAEYARLTDGLNNSALAGTAADEQALYSSLTTSIAFPTHTFLGFYDHTTAPIGSEAYWYSEESLNTDGFDHMVALVMEQTSTSVRLLLGFEDLPVRGTSSVYPGDGDYNDLVVEVVLSGEFTPLDPPVPEPATLGLLGLALAGSYSLRRKRA